VCMEWLIGGTDTSSMLLDLSCFILIFPLSLRDALPICPREVIDYLTKSLGLQLLFVMPSSKSGAFLDLISNQFVFAKCPAPTPQGELQTLVHVDRQKLNQDRIQALWANHRRTIYNQGSFDFMEEFG